MLKHSKQLAKQLCTGLLMALTASVANAVPLGFSIDKVSLVNSADLSNELLVIDSFTTAQAAVESDNAANYWNQSLTPETLGGTRIIDLGNVGGGIRGGSNTLDVSGGRLNYAGQTEAGVFNAGRIHYQGQVFSDPGNVTGGLPVGTDLTLGGQANGYLIDITTDANTAVDLTVLSINRGGFLPNDVSGRARDVHGSQTIFLAFGADGVGSGPADDVTLWNLSFLAKEYTPPAGVPAPATLGLVVVGLMVLVRRRRS